MSERASRPADGDSSEAPRAKTRRGLFCRLRVPLALVCSLLLIRLALPFVLRPILEREITEQLVGHIEIGAVELGLFAGRFGLREVAIFERRTPGAEAELAAAERPLVSVGRLAVRIAPFALFRRTVHLREIEIERPAIDLARLADGRMNLLRVIPERAETPAPETPAEPWIVAIDHVTLAGGKLVFNDLAVSGAEALDLDVDRIAVDGLQIGGEPTPDSPARITLEAHHPDGPLRLELALPRLMPVPVVAAHLVLEDFPLRRAQVYVPGTGWSGLAGNLDLDLSLDFEAEQRSVVKGTASVTDAAITVADLDAPALGWKKLEVGLDALDLIARKIDLSNVSLAGLALVVTPGEESPLPLLRPAARAGARAPARVPAVSSGPAEPSADWPQVKEPLASSAIEPEAPAKPAQPFDVAIGAIALDDARLSLRGAHVAPLELALALNAREFSLAKNATFPVSLELREGTSGLSLDGRARIDAPGFAGTLKFDGLDLPRLAAAAGRAELGPVAALRRATLVGELTVDAGVDASGMPAGDDLRISGNLTLSGVEVGDGTNDVLALRLDELALGEMQVQVPGLIARAASPSPGPLRVAIGELRLVKPQVDAVRTAAGIALPKPLATESGSASSAETQTPVAVREETAGDAVPPLQLDVARLHVEGGRVTLDDRSVTPFFKNGLSNLRLDASAVSWPDRRIAKLDLSATTIGRAKLTLTGGGDATGTTLVFDGKKLPLPPLNPYATAAGYSIRGGELSLVSSIWLGAIGFEAKNWVTLHDFDLAELSSDGRFEESFGVSLPLGIALLKDLNGDIQLTIPVWQDASGFGVGVAEVVRGALGSALLGALTSPLKMLGAVIRPGEKAGIGTPEPIPFAAGSDTLLGEAVERLEGMAQVLSGQPALVLELQPVASPADERRLRELALLDEIDREGVLGTLRSLPRRASMNAVREFLSKGEGTLDEPAQALLDERIAGIALPPDRLQQLAAARLDRVRTQLRDAHGIPERQLAAREARIGEDGARPELRVLFGR